MVITASLSPAQPGVGALISQTYAKNKNTNSTYLAVAESCMRVLSRLYNNLLIDEKNSIPHYNVSI